MLRIILTHLLTFLNAVAYALPPTDLVPSLVERDTSIACPTDRPFYLSYNGHNETIYAESTQYQVGPRQDVTVVFTSYANANPTTYIFVENEGGCQLSIPSSDEPGAKVYRSVVTDYNEKFSDVHVVRLSFRQFLSPSVTGEELYCHTNKQQRLFCTVSKANFPTQHVLGFPFGVNEDPSELGGELLIFAPGSSPHSGYAPVKINVEFQDVA